METDFEITMENLEETIKKINRVLDHLIMKAEKQENYELCHKIYMYQKIVIPRYIAEKVTG